MLAVLFGAAALAVAQSSLPSGRQITPTPLALDRHTRRLYAIDTDRDLLWMLDLKTGQQTSIAVGKRPIAVALDEAAHRGYTVDAGSGSVSVVDLDANRVVAMVQTDAHPYAIAVDPHLHRIYVSNTFSNQLTAIDGTKSTATALEVGSKDALLADPLRGRVWLCSYESDQLGILDEHTSSVHSIAAANHIWALTQDPTGESIFAVSIGSDQLLRIASDGSLVKRRVGSMPDALAVDSILGHVYVANYADNSITVLTTATLDVLATVTVGRTPEATVVDETRHRVYVANTHDNTVSVLDGRTNRVVATEPAGYSPYSLIVDADSGDLFAATLGDTPYRRIPLRGAKP